MLSVGPAAGGAFKGAAQMGQFNHNHASVMGRIAAARAQARAMLGPPQPPAAPVGPGGIPAAPAAPMAPQAPQVPPAMAGGMTSPMPHPQGNFKMHVAHAVTQLTGQPVSHNHVLSAIDRMAAKGAFTPLQGQALKAHSGPLVGPQGRQVMTALAGEVMNGLNNAG